MAQALHALFYRTCRTSRPVTVLLCIVFCALASAAQRPTPKLTPQQAAVLQEIVDCVYRADYVHARKMAIRQLNRFPDNPLFCASVNATLADIETATDNRKKALYYLRKAETLFRRNAALRPRLCMIAWKYANLYYEDKQYDSAYFYARYAIDSSKVHLPEHYAGLRASNLPIIGYHHYLKGRYALAAQTYDEALAVNAANGSESENVNTYLKIADLAAKQSDYADASDAGRKAYALADRHGIQPYKLAAVNKLIDIHRQFGDYKEMARCLQLKMDLMDAISLADQKKSLKELEAKYKSELKDQENRSLKTINARQRTENGFLLTIIVLSALVAVVVLIFAAIFLGQKRRISRQKADVERLNLLNQKIFSVISHDFKGPMMGLDLLLGMQEKYKLDAERFTSQSNQLRSDLQQANNILENLLSWSRTELGAGGPQQSHCTAQAVAAAVIAQLDPSIRKKQLTVVCEIPAELAVPVTADSLTIILRNLVGNAIKYSHDGGTITVAYDTQTQRFSVSDRGTGMDADRLQQLFLRQLDSKLGTHHETGYGIGLQFVYELVRKNNGTIRAESKPGEGTTVYFRFGTKKENT